jgi:hypothetical protein
VVSFTHRPLYPQEKSPWYPLGRRLGGLQSRSGSGDEEKNSHSVIKSRRIRWAGHVARMGDGRDIYRVLVGRPEDKRPLGRPRHRWEDNTKTDLRELGISGANPIQLDQDRVQWRAFVNTVMKLRIR